MAKKKTNRAGEADLSKSVLDVLDEQPSGQASIATLNREIRQRHPLSPEDWAPSKTRRNESLWEQIVRNIKSHDKVPGNIIREGYAEAVKGGYKITKSGRLRVKARHH